MLLEASTDPDAIHDPRARERDVVRALSELTVPTDELIAAAASHGRRRGRAAFSAVGRSLCAVDAHGAVAYPHTQAARDGARLDQALSALEAGESAAALRALEAVGSNRLTRTLSEPAFATHLARREPDAPGLQWAHASHLTASPDLWQELSSLRGEPGARPVGDWLVRSVVRHRQRVAADLRQRLNTMTLALQPDPAETP